MTSPDSFEFITSPKGNVDRIPLLINLYGGPSSGKTMHASRLFVELKALGLEVAKPEEHAKQEIWNNRPEILDHQIILFGKLWDTLFTLRDKVDVIIIDSPILLCSAYGGERETKHFHKLIKQYNNKTDRVNLVVKRPKSIAYDPKGRRENEENAKKMDNVIAQTLIDFKEPFTFVKGTQNSAKKVALHTKSWLDSKHKS